MQPVLYHGETKGEIKGQLVTPFFAAHDKGVATTYSENGAVVRAIRDVSRKPLVLDTPEKFVEAWEASGADKAEGPFHPNKTSALAAWARAQGHDAIVVPQSAFEGELGYEVVGGTLGEAQTIILDPAAAEFVK